MVQTIVYLLFIQEKSGEASRAKLNLSEGVCSDHILLAKTFLVGGFLVCTLNNSLCI